MWPDPRWRKAIFYQPRRAELPPRQKACLLGSGATECRESSPRTSVREPAAIRGTQHVGGAPRRVQTVVSQAPGDARLPASTACQRRNVSWTASSASARELRSRVDDPEARHCDVEAVLTRCFRIGRARHLPAEGDGALLKLAPELGRNDLHLVVEARHYRSPSNICIFEINSYMHEEHKEVCLEYSDPDEQTRE